MILLVAGPPLRFEMQVIGAVIAPGMVGHQASLRVPVKEKL
jgi:hypothetical protein